LLKSAEGRKRSEDLSPLFALMAHVLLRCRRADSGV
jgi:hypothetical protein